MNKLPLTQDIYDRDYERQLSGIFVLKEDVRFHRPFSGSSAIYVESEKIVFLKNGMIHNDNGPSLIHPHDENGVYFCFYYYKGIYQGINGGPAIEGYEGEITWTEDNIKLPPQGSPLLYSRIYRNDNGPHRLDGPARYSKYGNPLYSYFIDGKQYSKKEFDQHKDVVLFNKKNNIKNKMNKAFA